MQHGYVQILNTNDMIGLNHPISRINFSFEKKCFNIGLLIPSKITKNEKKRTLSIIDLFLSKLYVFCPENLYNNIINNSPTLYLTSTRIRKLNSQKFILYRQQQTFILCYDVSICDCCGKICINHDDNLLEKE